MSEEMHLGINRDIYRKNFNKYTRKAFQTLPKITKPRILDIGCGTGVSTLELAKISEGVITAIDIDQDSLDVFTNKIEKLGLIHQIQVIKCSIHEMTFTPNTFDIIWMEGLQFIDFDTRLDLCNPLLKPNGFLVIHEDQKDTEIKISCINEFEYSLFLQFDLPDDAWWEEYYQFLEKSILRIISSISENSDEMKAITKVRSEINYMKLHPEDARSMFFILQKKK